MRSNMRSVKRQPAAETADLRWRLNSLLDLRRELSPEAMAEEARVSPNSLRALLSGETKESREHVRDRLFAYLAQQAAAAAPHVAAEPVGYVTGHASGSIRFTGAAMGSSRTDRERMVYAAALLEAAERYRVSLGVELALALQALTAATADGDAGAVVEIVDRLEPPPESSESRPAG